jgi:hypothetical protein
MPRSTKKSTTQEIAEALNTPVNLNWCDVAEELDLLGRSFPPVVP